MNAMTEDLAQDINTQGVNLAGSGDIRQDQRQNQRRPQNIAEAYSQQKNWAEPPSHESVGVVRQSRQEKK